MTLDRETKKTIVFIAFWTIVLAPFEYCFLHLPTASIILIRICAVFSNILWLKLWYEKPFWKKKWGEKPPLHISIFRMVSVKFFVNITNFTVLFFITLTVTNIWNIETGLHFTMLSLCKKITYVSMFAVLLTPLYTRVLEELGLAPIQPPIVDEATQIYLSDMAYIVAYM